MSKCGVSTTGRWSKKSFYDDDHEKEDDDHDNETEDGDEHEKEDDKDDHHYHDHNDNGSIFALMLMNTDGEGSSGYTFNKIWVINNGSLLRGFLSLSVIIHHNE